MHRKATEKLWLNLTVANKLGQIYPIFVKCRIKDTQAPMYRSCSSAHELTGSTQNTHSTPAFHTTNNNYKYEHENNLHLIINGNNRILPICILTRR